MFSLLLKHFVELLKRVTSYSLLLYQEDISASKQVYAVFYRQIFIRDIKQLFLANVIFSTLILAVVSAFPVFNDQSMNERFLIYFSLTLVVHLCLSVLIVFIKKRIFLAVVTVMSILLLFFNYGSLQRTFQLQVRINFAVEGISTFVILIYCQGSFFLSFCLWTLMSLSFIALAINGMAQASFVIENIVLQVSLN